MFILGETITRLYTGKSASLFDTAITSVNSPLYIGEFKPESFKLIEVWNFGKKIRKEFELKKKADFKVVVAKGVIIQRDGTEVPHQSTRIDFTQIDRRDGILNLFVEGRRFYKLRYRELKGA